METIDFKGKQYSREMKPVLVEAPGVYEISCFPPRKGGLLIEEIWPVDVFHEDMCQRLNELKSEALCGNRINGDVCKVTGNKCDDYEVIFCKDCIEI